MISHAPSQDTNDAAEISAGGVLPDGTAFLVSLIFHLGLLVALGLIPAWLHRDRQTVALTSTPTAEEVDSEDMDSPEQFHFSDQPSDQIGAHSVDDFEMAMSLAPIVSKASEVPSPLDAPPIERNPRFEINNAIEVARGLRVDHDVIVKGAVGQGVTGALGAIDRITHEILLSLEERKTLVVWLFDQSGSLHRQRQAIHQRLDRIYEELGVIAAAKNPAFARYDDKPLLTSVVAFGEKVSLRTPKPTDDVEQIKQAIREIELDESGTERVFSAVYMAAKEYRDLRVPAGSRVQPERNVLLVVLTDEAGDDADGLDPTVQICQRYAIPVYVIGVPAPFGRAETLVKWVDPDPAYDQSPQWGRVNQGPESCLPERVKLHFAGQREDEAPLDSGFGPFALTRLSYETGGIYFTVHPNRNLNRAVGRRETAAFSSHLSHFFDPEVMRKYRPDYVSQQEYARQASENRARAALLTASQMSWVTPMTDPRLRFVKRDDASFVNELTAAQKAAAKLEPQVQRLYDVLKEGEADREKEFSARWQAGYDLAMGRVAAVHVRTRTYNAMLAQAKRGMELKSETSNTWTLRPANEVSVGSQLAKVADMARLYLQRVIDEHPETPWALLAQRELQTPMGWEWQESHTNLAPPRASLASAGGNPPRAARNDRARMLPKPPPRRQPPRL